MTEQNNQQWGRVQQFLKEEHTWPAEWRGAAFSSDALLKLTPGEMEEFETAPGVALRDPNVAQRLGGRVALADAFLRSSPGTGAHGLCVVGDSRGPAVRRSGRRREV
jgi:hypothetical protein